MGKARPNPRESLQEAMEREHCAEADADVAFDARNYRTRTTSRLEWWYVARPEALPELSPYLEELGQPTMQWPMIGSLSEGTDDDELRHPKTFAQFEKERRRIDAQLAACGEQPLSFVEFVALRCYSGPLFVKYNNVLRAGVCSDFMDFLDHVCCGNRYPTTIHVLTAAIIKLGKFTVSARSIHCCGSCRLARLPCCKEAFILGWVGCCSAAVALLLLHCCCCTAVASIRGTVC